MTVVSRVELTNIHCLTWASYLTSLRLEVLIYKSGMMVDNSNTNGVMYVKCLAQFLNSIKGTLHGLLSWSLQGPEMPDCCLTKAAILGTMSLLWQKLCLLLFLLLSTPFPDLHCYH